MKKPSDRPPVRRNRLRRGDTVYGRLKAEITSLRMPPGERLYETDVADRFHASRTPVREALMRLLQEGLLTRNGRPYTVRVYTSEDVEQLYEIREALETIAVRGAIARAGSSDIENLRGLIETMDRMVRQGDVAGFNALDSRFHLTIAAIAGNPFLEYDMASLHDKVRIIRNRQLGRLHGLANAHADHGRIMSAIERRDTGIAEAEMRYHIQASIALLLGRRPWDALDVQGARPKYATGGGAEGSS